MKTHLIRQEYKTGERVTHFKTICGKARHIVTDLQVAKDISEATCKICLSKKISDSIYHENTTH